MISQKIKIRVNKSPDKPGLVKESNENDHYAID